MFIGHFALGYAAKRWVPRVSLAVLFAAAQLADFLWPVLVAVGVERVRIVPGFTVSTPLEFISYPYSHSLATLVLWGALFGWVCTRWVPGRRVFLVVCALVVSHWVLDFVTHVPDMPLYPGGPRFGLGLWNAPAATFVVEIVMFATGVWIYSRATRAEDRVGRWAFIGVTAFLLAGFIANAGGTPPPSVNWMVAAGIVLGWLTLAVAWWADRHRESGKWKVESRK